MNYFAFVEEDVMFLATENDLAGIIEKMSFRLSIFDIIYSLNKCQLWVEICQWHSKFNSA